MRSLRDYINIVDNNLTEAPVAAFGKNAAPAAAPAAVPPGLASATAPAAPAAAPAAPAAPPNLDQQKAAAIGGGAPPATSAQIKNPYTGADAEKFARLSPEDQAWYTKGGGKPDLNDPAIAARAPNKGQLAAAAPAAPAAGPDTSTAAGAMAAASGGAAAGAAAPANPAKPGAAAGAANPATGVNAQGQNVSITNPDGSKTNSETGETTPAQAATPAPEPAAAEPAAAPAAAAAPANRDAMPFGKAFADAKAKGEKEFTWKGKKYAVAMAKPAAAPAKPAQAATPAPAKQGGSMWNPMNWFREGSQATDENIQMNEFDMGAESEIGKIMKNAGLDSLNDEPTSDIPNPNKEAPGANIPNPPSFSGKADPKELLKNMPEPELAKLSGDEAKDLLMQMKKLAGM